MDYLRKGTYEVYWENEVSDDKITTNIDVYQDVLIGDIAKYFKSKIETFHENEGVFDTFKETRYKLIEEYTPKKDLKIRIVPYDNEVLINDLLDNGYVLREFFNDKCIVEYNKKETL